MKRFAYLLLGAVVCFAVMQVNARIFQTDLPVVPDSLVPQDGSVVEYWPNGEVRAEVLYRDSKVTSAAYYASDGSPIYELATD